MARPFFGIVVVGVYLATTATATLADNAKDEAIKKERKLYEGTWRVVALEVNGNKVKQEDATKLRVVNAADGTWSLRLLSLSGVSRQRDIAFALARIYNLRCRETQELYRATAVAVRWPATDIKKA